MSRRGVQMAVATLLRDEDVRIRFVIDRTETVAELIGRGSDLSADEIDLFVGTDAGLWFLSKTGTGGWQR